MPMPHMRVVATTFLSIAVLGASLAASGPAFWTTAAPADFLKGTSDGVYVNLNGTLTAGPLLTNRLTSTPAQIWSVAEAPDGSLWAGTGGDGRVVRLRAGQPEQTVFDAPESNIFALAIAGTRVYAASSPDGKVYAIEGDGTSRTFFDPPEKYIWALSVDTAGRLWIGAGDPAVIYRVDPNGTSQAIYHPPAAHVVSFARDSSGRLLAGTESPGRLYRFDAADKPFVVLDTGASEVRAIASDGSGALYAAVVIGGSDDSSSGDETASVSVASTATTTATSSGASSTSSTASGSRRSTLYRIESNGTWEAIWQTGDVIYDLTPQADGLLVATGPSGRLYKVGANRTVQLLTGVDAKQITKFATSARVPTTISFATANPGRVVAMGPGEQPSSAYMSAVKDTKSAATWGLIRWEGTNGLQLSTRSGNTETPDDSWSPWSTPYTRREGEAVTSPAARFLQWRVMFTKPAAPPAAQLTGVTVAYLTANGRPVVTSVTTPPPGVVFQRPFANEEGAIAGLDDAVANARRAPGDTGPATPAPGRRMFQRGLQTVSWKADDPDDDDRLTYSLEYRREGTDQWRPLKSGLTDGIYVWDTTSAPDGRYVVRVKASDSPSNAADRALVGERESDPIDVDNTPPVVTTTLTRQGAASVLAVRVVDARSPIQKVEYSVGGGPWQLLYPADGLSDSPEERYEIPLTAEMDPSRIVIRATDLLQNTMSQAVQVQPAAR